MMRINDLVDADAVNTPVAIDLLTAFDPGVIEVYEATSELFEQFIDCAAQRFSALDSQDGREIETIAQQAGMSHDEMLARLRAGTNDAGMEEAHSLWRRMRARQAKRFVLLLLYRYFRWGATDLIRFRVSPVAGYGRLQAEAVALLRLFADEPGRAIEWLQTGTNDGDGTQFYRATQGRLRAIMQHYQLLRFYERGSSSFQHVRMGAAVPGLTFTDDGTQLRDQEVDPDDAGSYIRRALVFLSTQLGLFRSLPDAVADVRCDGWNERHHDVGRQWATLWSRLEQEYPVEGPEQADPTAE